MQVVEPYWFHSNLMGKCRICRGSFICFDFIETKVQPSQPECHLSPDHTITEFVFLCGFTIHFANSSCCLAKGHKITFLWVTHSPSQETCPFNISYLEEKQATWTGFVNWCSKLAHSTSLQSLTIQKNLCRQPILFWHPVKSYESH